MAIQSFIPEELIACLDALWQARWRDYYCPPQAKLLNFKQIPSLSRPLLLTLFREYVHSRPKLFKFKFQLSLLLLLDPHMQINFISLH